MSQRYAPIRDPQFEGRPTIDGVPAATMQDLMELRHSWLDKLNDRVVELFFSNGNAAVAAPNSNPISNSSLSNRVAVFMNRVRPHHTPAGSGLLVGLPAGADFHYPGDPTPIPDVQIRNSGIFPTTSAYRYGPFKKGSVWYIGEVSIVYSLLDKKTITHAWTLKHYAGAQNGYFTGLDSAQYLAWINWRSDNVPTQNGLPLVMGTENGTHETQPTFGPDIMNPLDPALGIEPPDVSHRDTDFGIVYWCMAIREQS